MAVDVLTPEARRAEQRLERIWDEPRGILGWLRTTDHKRIGILYFFTSFAFLAAGGLESVLMRTQLIGPNEHVLSAEAYSQAFTMHGVTMIFLFVIPMSTGAFGNYLLPLMIGARDMAFPRLNAFSFWVYLAAGLFIYASVFMGRAPDAGWFNYVPLASRSFSTGSNIDFYALGLLFTTVSTTAGAINIVVTTLRMRAPQMAINRMPLFCYALVASAGALIFALPALSCALILLELDRLLGMHFYDVAQGGNTILWQHLFWIFGHPEVYIIVLPAFGIATSIIPAFTHRRMVAFPLVAVAEVLVAFIGFGVWAHHMFAVGLPTVTTVYFGAASLMIVIPSGIQLFAWIMTILTGTPRFTTPLLWIVGFIVFFIFGGLSGVMFAAIPFDQQVHDTYFVVAHFHFVIFGAAVFPIFGGMFFWFPKVTGRLYNEALGKLSFWLAFAGTALTFFPMHILGLLGMPRRNYTYPADMGWTGYNLVATLGAYILTAGLLLVFVNLGWSRFRGAPAGPDPWNAATLEWATTSPPPPYNFTVVPTVSSPYPMWDEADRLRDTERLADGEGTLEQGHEAVSTTPLDANADEVVRMPSESWFPLASSVVITAVFVLVLTQHFAVAGAFALLAAAVAGGWHLHETEEPVPL